MASARYSRENFFLKKLDRAIAITYDQAIINFLGIIY